MLIEFLLILFAMDFLQLGKYLLPILLLAILLLNRKLYFHFDFWLLLTFAIIHCLFSGLSGSGFSTVAFFCPFAYLVGLNVKPGASDDQLFRIIALLAIGMAFHGVLNLLYEIYLSGQLPQGRVHYDIWSKARSAVTGQMANYALLAGMFGYLLFGFRKSLVFYALLVLSLLQAVVYGSRTHLILCLLSILISFVACAFVGPRKKWKNLFRIALCVASVVFVVFVAYSVNAFGFKHVIQSSYLYHRLFSDYALSNGAGFFDTDRWSLKVQYFQLAFEYPFGGSNIRAIVGYYAHDFWLDVYDQGGIFSFALVGFYTLRLVGRFLCLFTNKLLLWEYRALYLSLLVVVLAQMFVEPVLQAAPVLVCSMMLIDGAIASSRILSPIREDITGKAEDEAVVR